MCYPSNKGRYDLERGSEILRTGMVTTCQVAITMGFGDRAAAQGIGRRHATQVVGGSPILRRSGQTWLPLLWAQKTEHPARRVTVDPYNVMEFARLSRATQLASSS